MEETVSGLFVFSSSHIIITPHHLISAILHIIIVAPSHLCSPQHHRHLRYSSSTPYTLSIVRRPTGNKILELARRCCWTTVFLRYQLLAVSSKDHHYHHHIRLATIGVRRFLPCCLLGAAGTSLTTLLLLQTRVCKDETTNSVFGKATFPGRPLHRSYLCTV